MIISKRKMVSVEVIAISPTHEEDETIVLIIDDEAKSCCGIDGNDRDTEDARNYQ